MLNELEQLGLAIIVLKRNKAKAIETFDCSFCNQSKGLQENRNCTGDTNNRSCLNPESEKVVFYHDLTGALCSCPLHFISPTLWECVDMIDYYTRFPSAMPSYENVNSRFWEAIKLFDDYSHTVSIENIKNSKTESDGFSDIKNRWRSKNEKS